MYYNECFLWRTLCWVWEKKQHNNVFLLSNCHQVLKIFYDWPVKYRFWDDFGIWLLGCTKDRVQFSIYFTRALIHKYFVALTCRRFCISFILSESPPLKMQLTAPPRIVSILFFNIQGRQLHFLFYLANCP